MALCKKLDEILSAKYLKNYFDARALKIDGWIGSDE